MSDQELQDYQADGYRGRRLIEGNKEYMLVKAHAALTALTPYPISHDGYGPVTRAFADDTKWYWVGVPLNAQAANDIFYIQIRGPVEDMVVPSDTYILNEGIEVLNGAVAGTNAAYAETAEEFAVVTTAITAAAVAADVFLVGERIQAST